MVRVMIGNTIVKMTDSQYEEFVNDKADKEFLEECKEVSKMFKKKEVNMGKCICGQDIFHAPTIKRLGECMYCHRFYKFEKDKWLRIDREEFRQLYRIKLIEKQLSNRGDIND